MSEPIKIIKDGTILQTTGIFAEGSSDILFNSNGNINCNEIIEAPVYSTTTSYTPDKCLNYSTTVAGGKGWSSRDWPIGEYIYFIIPCTDGTFYISIVKTLNKTDYAPTGLLHISNSKTQLPAFITTNKELIFPNIKEV